MSRRCDREGVVWPPPVYGPPRPARRCGWCDRTDDAVAYGYDHLPPACPDHQPERSQALADIAALHTDASGEWTKKRAPEASVRRVHDAGEAFARGAAADDGWVTWPQPKRTPVALPSDDGARS